MNRYLLIDGGQSGCRVVFVADGNRAGSGSGAELSCQARDWAGGVLAVLEQGIEDVDPGAVDVVVAGLTGFDASPETARDSRGYSVAGELRTSGPDH